MTFVETLLSPLQPAAATLLSPSSICSIYSLRRGADDRLRLARLSAQRRDRRVVLKTLARAVFSRRVLLHRSTFADLAYCVIGLATLGAIIGWAVVSTSWISDGVAAFLTSRLGPPPQPQAPEVALNARGRSRSFSLMTSASFSITRSSTASRRYGSFIRRTTRPRC